jgi:hypothetical protein
MAVFLNSTTINNCEISTVMRNRLTYLSNRLQMILQVLIMILMLIVIILVDELFGNLEMKFDGLVQ